MIDWIPLIYDREQWEVDLIKLDPLNANNRGSYNTTDLNRIENNCLWIQSMLNDVYSLNPPINLITKLDWVIEDIPQLGDIERIRTNIETLQNFLSTLQYDEIIHDRYMDFNKANILEKNLNTMYEVLSKIQKEYHYCGTFYCGDYGIGGRLDG